MAGRSRRNGAWVLLSVLVLGAAGCSGSGSGIAPGTSSGNLTMIKAEASDRVFLAAPEPANGTTMTAASGFGIVRDPQVEGYLQGIVARLMQHWHGDKPARVGIFVQSGDSVQGKATPSGDILIPIGAFDGIESEDQLAALIGHELGHIVLNHHEDERQAKELAKLGQMAVAGAFMVSNVRNSGMRRYGNTREFYIKDQNAVNSDTLQAFAVHTAMVTLTQDIILSAYSREQEHTADVFGMTLAGRSGWDPRAILSLIQKWHDAEETRRQEKQALVEQAGLVAGVVQGVGDVAASITGSHPSAEDRRDNVAKAMQATFKDVAPVPPSIASYQKAVGSGRFARKRDVWRQVNKASKLLAKGQVDEAAAILKKLERKPDAAHPESRLVMATAVGSQQIPGASETAYHLLASADLNQPATLDFYERLLIEHTLHNNLNDAEHVAQIGEKYYGERMLPSRIEALRLQAVGQPKPPQQLAERMSEYMQRCKASANPELPRYCQAASTGANSDKDYEVCGGVIGAVASLTGNGKCDPDDATKASNSGGLVNGVIGSIFGQ